MKVIQRCMTAAGVPEWIPSVRGNGLACCKVGVCLVRYARLGGFTEKVLISSLLRWVGRTLYVAKGASTVSRMWEQ
jgi:hypothetical protein